MIAEGFTRLRDQEAWDHYLDVLTTDAGGGYAALEVYKAREGDRKMAWKLAAQRAGGPQGLLGESTDLDAVVIGDPMGVYCRAWKWGKVKHVVFKEQHKERVAVTSGGVEQVTLEEALE